MAVYLFAAPTLGVCKIGYATDVLRRHKIIQTTCPATVVILAEREGDRWTEACLHRHFASLRTHGEWFTFDSRIQDEFASVVIPPRPVSASPDKLKEADGRNDGPLHPLKAFRLEYNLTLKQLADRIGLKKPTVCQIEKGDRQIAATRVMGVSDVTGIPPHVLRPDIFRQPGQR